MLWFGFFNLFYVFKPKNYAITRESIAKWPSDRKTSKIDIITPENDVTMSENGAIIAFIDGLMTVRNSKTFEIDDVTSDNDVEKPANDVGRPKNYVRRPKTMLVGPKTMF